VAKVRLVILLIDINILLDLLQRRGTFDRPAAELFAAVEMKRAKAYVSGHTITTAYYIIRRASGAPAAESAVLTLLRVLNIVPVAREDLMRALSFGWGDFEDAVQAVCASKIKADFIVTRNLRDFRDSSVPAREPAFILPLLR
jgi:predicted nucleic acid-binding protein